MEMINTWYGDIEQALLKKFQQVRLLVLDVMGYFRTAVFI